MNSGESGPEGIQWDGDIDNEVIFGTSWHDLLNGGGGDDLVYGFEGDDVLVGGYGMNRLFGDGGDDLIFLGTEATVVGPGRLEGEWPFLPESFTSLNVNNGVMAD